MKSLDIVLVKPGSQKQIYGELSDFQLTALEPPLWGALLSAYLRQEGYSVEMLDAEVENWSYELTAKKISEIRPALAGIMVSGTNPSASTMNMIGAGAILRYLKDLNPGIKTILLGLHPSALPQRTLMEEEVDFVCQGEGFFTLPRLLDALQDKTNKFDIPGLWLRENGRAVSNANAPLLGDLDVLPMPAWDLLPMEKYRAHNWHCFDHITERSPYVAIYTSLGCPFKCSFCCINALFGERKIRYRSPQKVVEEIDFLVNHYGIKNIKIIDEMFAMNEARVIDLCNLIIERRYDLNMWAYGRVNTATPRMLEKMREAGIRWIAYGFESGSKRVLEDVSKGYKVETVDKVVKMTQSQGIYICANFIFGLPEDDFDSMQETLQLMIEINAEWANIYSAMAYPGSALYKLAVQNNWPLPESWEGYSQYAYDTLPLPTRNLSGSQVLSFRDYAFATYYRSPQYLDMIGQKFGQETVAHIKEMSSHKLPRKNIQK